MAQSSGNYCLVLKILEFITCPNSVLTLQYATSTTNEYFIGVDHFISLLFSSIFCTYYKSIHCVKKSFEEVNSDGFDEANECLNVIMQSYPTRKTLMQYIATLSNKDLLSTRALVFALNSTCKLFYKLPSEKLNQRIKPLFMRSTRKSGSTYVSMVPKDRISSRRGNNGEMLDATHMVLTSLNCLTENVKFLEMIAHTWKFSEVKEMHFTLLLISLCFIAIDGGPITTIPTEETNRDGFIEKCEDLNILMNAPYSVQKEIAKYFVTFNNSDLLSVAATCKSLCGFTKKMLNERMKPLIITNGTTDQQIFSIYEENLYTHDFLMLNQVNSQFCLQKLSDKISLFFPDDGLINIHPRSAVIFPKFYNASVDFFVYDSRHVFYSPFQSKMVSRIFYDRESNYGFLDSALDLLIETPCFFLYCSRNLKLGLLNLYHKYDNTTRPTSTISTQPFDLAEAHPLTMILWSGPLAYL
uniref:Uncharacterized protein n=1 Tax=Onchocerca volvulus TaxID=6282 RepID=A0A8R1XS29_ONCVO